VFYWLDEQLSYARDTQLKNYAVLWIAKEPSLVKLNNDKSCATHITRKPVKARVTNKKMLLKANEVSS
jgi:hypothetical protein